MLVDTRCVLSGSPCQIPHCSLFCDHTATLRFQPTKRPQQPLQKPRPRPTAPDTRAVESPRTDVASASKAPAPAPRTAPKSTLADWTGDGDDVNGFYGGGEKRQRGGRKKRKKGREEYSAPQDWDDIYDPSRPNNYEEYKNSDEKIREVREWKDRLYAHRLARRQSSPPSSDDEAPARPQMNSKHRFRVPTLCAH